MHDLSRRRILTATSFTMLGLYAVATTALSPLMPELMSHFGISAARAGLISSLQNIGGLLLCVPAIFFADRLNKGWLLLIAGIVMTIGMAGMGLPGVSVFTVFLWASLIYGMGSRLVDSISAAFLTDCNPDRTAVWVAFSHVAYGLMALLTPWLVMAVAAAGLTWQWNFLLTAIVMVVILAVHALSLRGVPVRAGVAKSRFSLRDILTVMADRTVLAAAFIILFQAVGFFGYITWIPSYLELELGTAQGLAGMSVSLFFVGNICGKLLLGLLSRHFSTRTMLMVSPLVMGPAIGLGALMGHPVVAVALAPVAGLAMAMNIPFSIEAATRGRADKTGAVTSFLFIVAFLGSSLGGWLTGLLADNASLGTGLLIVGAGFCMLAFISALFLPRTKNPL